MKGAVVSIVRKPRSTKRDKKFNTVVFAQSFSPTSFSRIYGSQALLETLLLLLKNEGEEAAFTFIRKNVLRKKWYKNRTGH